MSDFLWEIRQLITLLLPKAGLWSRLSRLLWFLCVFWKNIHDFDTLGLRRVSKQGTVIAELPQELQCSTWGSLQDKHQRDLSPLVPLCLQLPKQSVAVKCDWLLAGSCPEFSPVAEKEAVTPKARPASTGEGLSPPRSCRALPCLPNFLHLWQ